MAAATTLAQRLQRQLLPPINIFTVAGICLFIFFVGSAIYTNVAMLTA